MSSSLTIEVVEEGTSDLDFLMSPDFTSDNFPSFSNSIDFVPNPSLLPPIITLHPQPVLIVKNSFPPHAANPTPSPPSILPKQQPKRRVTSNQSTDRKLSNDLMIPPKNQSISTKKSDSNGVIVPPESVNSVNTESTSNSAQPRSKLRRLRKPVNNTKKSSNPLTSQIPSQSSNLNLSIDTNLAFDSSQRLKTPNSASVNVNDASPLFPETSSTSFSDQYDEDDVFLKEEEIGANFSSERVDFSTTAFDSYQLEDMDSQDMFDSFTPIILQSNDDPFMDDDMDNTFFSSYQTTESIVIPPPLLMTEQTKSTSLLMPHYIPAFTDRSSNNADKSKKSLRRVSRNKSQKPILPSNLRNEVVPTLVRVESNETVSAASETCESTSQTPSPRSKSQANNQHHTSIQGNTKPKQSDNTNKSILFCESGYELSAHPSKKTSPQITLTPQIQFVSSTPKPSKGISKPCKMSSSGWKFHNFDREKQPIRDSSGFTYHFYEPKSKIATTQ